MVWQVLAGAALGGIFGRQKAPDYGPLAEAQKYAADKQFEASERNRKAWKAENERQREDYAPYIKYGRNALMRMQESFKNGEFDVGEWDGGDFKLPAKWKGYSTELPDWSDYEEGIDPTKNAGYEFRRTQGEKAIGRHTSALGMARSGATQKALLEYNQGFASHEYEKAHSRAVQNYQLDYRTAQERRMAERERYDLRTRRGLLDRDIQMQDLLTRQDLLDRALNRQLSQVNIGFSALNRSNALSYDIMGQESGQRNLGASALGAGAIGRQTALLQGQIEQNRVRQQNLQNILSGATLGADLAGIGGGGK